MHGRMLHETSIPKLVAHKSTVCASTVFGEIELSNSNGNIFSSYPTQTKISFDTESASFLIHISKFRIKPMRTNGERARGLQRASKGAIMQWLPTSFLEVDGSC